MKKISILFAIIIILIIGGLLFYQEGSLAVNRADTKPKIFVVEKGEALDTIINNLAKEGLIRNRVVFYWIVKQKGIERKIQAGDFRLTPAMDANQIAEELTHGTVDIWVTIPEGLRKEEIAEIMSQKFGIPETEFNALAKEGYLYPDTYLIPKNPAAQQIIDILTNTFNQKFTPEIDELIRAKGLTSEQAVILASLVEREALTDDRQEIANIIYKRYVNDWPLQIDATIQYALGYHAGQKTWWRKITQNDYIDVKSPYNTYLHPGLPPGPISNPGIASLQAVANANEKTKNWYYYHDANGNVYFAEELEDHENNAAN